MKRITDFERASIELIEAEIVTALENIELYDSMGEYGLAQMWTEFLDTLVKYAKDRIWLIMNYN